MEVLALHLQSAKAPRSHDRWQDVGPYQLLSPELGLEGGSVELAAEAGAAVLSHAGEMRERDMDSKGAPWPAPGFLVALTCHLLHIPVAAQMAPLCFLTWKMGVHTLRVTDGPRGMGVTRPRPAHLLPQLAGLVCTGGCCRPTVTVLAPF